MKISGIYLREATNKRLRRMRARILDRVTDLQCERDYCDLKIQRLKDKLVEIFGTEVVQSLTRPGNQAVSSRPAPQRQAKANPARKRLAE